MIGLFVFLIGLIVIAVICVITFIVSKLIFDHHSNKVLAQGGNPSGKRSRMVYPGLITLATGVVLVILLAIGGSIAMSFVMIFDRVVSESSTYIPDRGYVEEDVPEIDVAYVRTGEYTPDEDLYALDTSSSDNGFNCSLYIRKDPSNNQNPLYVVVTDYSGSENPAIIEAEYLHDRSGTGSLTHLEGNEQLIYTPLWHAEYPGTLQITLKDGDGNNIIGRVAFALDGVSAD